MDKQEKPEKRNAGQLKAALQVKKGAAKAALAKAKSPNEKLDIVLDFLGLKE